MATHGPLSRVWRARRRHDHIDAEIVEAGEGWTLRFIHNDRPMIEWRLPTRDAAVDEASARLQQLQRAGWVTHW
jgi:hypothetical protein